MARQKQPSSSPVPARASGMQDTVLPAVAMQIRDAMARIGYDLPYERERIIQEARFYMAASAEAMLEAGRRLLVLKENEPHGEFEEIVRERLGIPERTAQRMMQSAVKFLLNPALQDKAPKIALLGKTKLFELLTEDDEDLAALAEGGTLAGCTLDEIESMTKRELQTALRDAREEGKAKDQLLADKNAKLDAARAKARKIAAAPLDEQLAQLKREATDIGQEAVAIVRGGLRQALTALNEHDHDTIPFAAGLVGQVIADCRALLTEFGLPEVIPDDETAWAQED